MSESRDLTLNLLSAFERKLRLSRSFYVFLNIAATVCLWVWFYFASGWLVGYVIDDVMNAQYFKISTMLILAYAALRFWAVRQRVGLAQQVANLFYDRFFDELMIKRWALIRSKPLTAWQDVTFRHLPAIEKYLIDYRAQLQLLVVIPFSVLVAVFPFSWLTGLTLLVTLPLIPLFMWLVGTGTATMQSKHMLALNRLGSFFADRIQGQRTVRIASAQSSQLTAFEKVSEQHNKRMAEVIRIAFLSGSVLDFFATVSVAIVAVFIGFALLGEITFGFQGGTPSLHHGLFLLLIAPAFFNEFKVLGKLYHVKAEASASTEQWHHTLQWQPSETLSQKSRINFQQLLLTNVKVQGFEGNTLVCAASLNLQQGDRVQLNGASGSGKTVLLDALAGLRQTTGGIELNGQAVASLNTLQASVFYLEQQPVFFAGTVRDNLSLGEVDDTKIIQAINDVGLGQWLKSQPAGLNTPLDEHTNLSGGQKQKLALARIIIFDVPLVLLDEPFAHLTEHEQDELFELLVKVTQSRTSIWISHRSMPTQAFNKQWWLSEQGHLSEAEL